jgi:hypothetical protein
VRRFAFVALVAAAACGRVTKTEPGPADRFYRPTGIGVYAGNLVVASSNSDLRYDDATGGTLIAVDPLAAVAGAQDAPLRGSVQIASFAGQLAVADPAACGLDPAQGALVLVPVRGANVLYRARMSQAGALTCDGCGLPLGNPSYADAFAVGLACSPGISRAYVGYLRSAFGQAALAQVDLTKEPGADGAIQYAEFGAGQVRGFAYDASRKRLYFTTTVTSEAAALSWIDLGGGCRLDAALTDPVRCRRGRSLATPKGLELRSIALANGETAPRRAYLTARIYDADAAATAGVRVGDFDGLLLVADLVETLAGELEVRVVDQLPIGYGAADVLVLPARAGRRDVVAALAADDGVLWVYDDETGSAVAIGRDLTRPPGAGAPTGAPEVGHVPFGLALDPAPLAGNVARLYVGSFQESFVTPIDVPLDDPETTCLVSAAGGCTVLRDEVRRIGGGLAGVTP